MPRLVAHHGLALLCLFLLNPVHCRFQLPPSPVVVILAASDVTYTARQLSTVGDRAFPATGSRFWNNLLPDITSAATLTVFFRNRLKTYLFSLSFPS